MTLCAPPDETQPAPRVDLWVRQTTRSHDENELLRLVATGDQGAYTRLYDQMSPRVFGLCLRLLRNHTDAEDVTQDVFLEVWTKAVRFTPSRGSAISWIYQIAHHRAVDRIRTAEAARRRDTSQQMTSQLHHEDNIQRLFDAINAHQVQAALDRLTERRREAVTYAFYTEHNYEQASALLGIPLGTFKSRVRDGLLALRSLLAEPS